MKQIICLTILFTFLLSCSEGVELENIVSSGEELLDTSLVLDNMGNVYEITHTKTVISNFMVITQGAKEAKPYRIIINTTMKQIGEHTINTKTRYEIPTLGMSDDVSCTRRQCLACTSALEPVFGNPCVCLSPWPPWGAGECIEDEI